MSDLPNRKGSSWPIAAGQIVALNVRFQARNETFGAGQISPESLTVNGSPESGHSNDRSTFIRDARRFTLGDSYRPEADFASASYRSTFPMNEFDLLILFDEYEDSFVGMMQWWASISLAIMVVSHFVGDKLRLPFVLGILILYSGFTFMVQILLSARADDMNNIMDTLSSLGNLSLVGREKADARGPLLLFTLLFSFWGTYTAAVAYLVWRFVRAKRATAVRPHEAS